MECFVGYVTQLILKVSETATEEQITRGGEVREERENKMLKMFTSMCVCGGGLNSLAKYCVKTAFPCFSLSCIFSVNRADLPIYRPFLMRAVLSIISVSILLT